MRGYAMRKNCIHSIASMGIMFNASDACSSIADTSTDTTESSADGISVLASIQMVNETKIVIS